MINSTTGVTTQELIERIEQGIEAARDSENFKRYLQTVAKFHRYSLGNVMLIAFQRPDATRVAGFHTWLQVGRHVRKGEHGIRILAPIVSKRPNDEDDETNTRTVVHFKAVAVFDIEQTDGADLPSPVILLTGADQGLYSRLAQVVADEGLTLDRNADERTPANGFYIRSGRRIWVNPELEPRMAAKTLAHELAHHFAEHDLHGHCREEAETIAEAAAFIVLEHFGIDAGGYTFGYIASWADTKTLKAKLAEIQKAASAIISAIEGADQPPPALAVAA